MSLAQKLADRFKPGIFDRLKQSAEAKKQLREKRLNVVPPSPHIRRVETIDTCPTSLGTQDVFNTVRIWSHWNTQLTASTTSCNTDNNVWQIWHGDTGTASTIWNTWTTGNTITLNAHSAVSNEIWGEWQTQGQPRRYQRPVETPEQRRQRDAEEAKWQQERLAQDARLREEERVRVRKKEEADERALKLLVSMLSPQQRADLKRDKCFFVDAPSGRLYRIDYGTHGNVKVIDRNTRKVLERLCIQQPGYPAGDANLMQKLLIETAEDLFRSHANITLENGQVIYGKREDLGAEQLAQVIPFRKAA